MVNLSSKLSNTRKKFSLFGKSALSRSLDDSIWQEIEETLISADLGVRPSLQIVEALREKARGEKITTLDELTEILKNQLKEVLSGFELSLDLDGNPAVWLLVGTNGVGKTTTIGKLAHRLHSAGNTVVLAAGDTFRAAASEQLEFWAEQAEVHLVKGAEGADPSSVIFDATEYAHARGVPLVIADTAGRLHTKKNLMEELSKIQRVAGKGPGTVNEILLVIDSTTGQNGLVQASQFAEAVDVTGIILTKLDGSSRGGIIFAIQEQLGIPIKLVGIGEGVEDLVPFDVGSFVDALFETKQ
tara:strand:- start:1963 stop:2862 length:900 start_codon:yes stop_codon:yes gene_type:complete